MPNFNASSKFACSNRKELCWHRVQNFIFAKTGNMPNSFLKGNHNCDLWPINIPWSQRKNISASNKFQIVFKYVLNENVSENITFVSNLFKKSNYLITFVITLLKMAKKEFLTFQIRIGKVLILFTLVVQQSCQSFINELFT